ncbi:hypothetical protein Tco_1363841 [Tanacetum coccineum]
MPLTKATMAKLVETMAKHYPEHVCKYYPDYPSYPPPPTSKPSRLEESMVALADTMAKIELASKRLAASTANLVPISTKTTTLISTIETASLVTKINKLDNTMVRFLSDSSAENEISQIPFSPVFGLQANPTNKTPKLRHPPSTAQSTHKKPKVPHEIAILNRHSPLTRVAASNTIATIHVLDMLTNPLKQTEALPLHRLSPKEIQIIRSHGLCFHCPETFHLNRMCPPKFVFLQSEPEPPWKPHDTRYTTMSLEDKTRFQERSIDTYMKFITKSSFESSIIFICSTFTSITSHAYGRLVLF